MRHGSASARLSISWTTRRRCALRDLDLASDDQLATATDRAATVPASKRFAAWSRRYLMLVAGADALVGGIAAAVPASISDTLSWGHRVALLCLVA